MKIVINKCYGGFGLSPKATERIAELQGRKCYWFKTEYPSREQILVDPAAVDGISQMMLACYDVAELPENADERNKHYIYFSNIDRTDPQLIQVVEELGEAASGACAKLRIIEIPDGTDWEIGEYDGMESVEEAHQSWS